LHASGKFFKKKQIISFLSSLYEQFRKSDENLSAMDNYIEKNRNKLDQIDKEILGLIYKRLRTSGELILRKIKDGIDIFDAAREQEIIDTLANEFDSRISKETISFIYKAILNEAKDKFDDENLSMIETKQPILIAGPCSIESKEQISRIAEFLSGIGIKYLRGGAYKPRTSPDSFQGLGDSGYEFIKNASVANNMLSVTEVLTDEQLISNYQNIDIVQIGSRNMTSYGLLKNIGKITAEDQKTVILKRGQSSTIAEFLHAAEYILETGNPNVILCLRGIRTFEQIDSILRNTADLSAILEIKSRTDLKVIFDPSHASGNSDMVLPLAKAAMDLGADGIMVESHFDPACSVSDAKQTINFDQTRELAGIMKAYRWKR
jgi:3-deoxy-7-phosphoheptulonate synthase/chorismate mutase